MQEAWLRDLVYAGAIPLYERFVSKAERDKMDEGDFAGKGKSFPINKPADVMAAVHSMGRAGTGNYGPAALKANIIRIAAQVQAAIETAQKVALKGLFAVQAQAALGQFYIKMAKKFGTTAVS
jgi:hypothetical protein